MPVLGESEKARLQRIFEWSNRGIGIPDPNRWRDNEQVDLEEVQLIRKRLLGRGALRKQKRWLDILANEVVERETVLNVMRAEGQKHLSKDQLRHEIQERIKRMKEIQNSIARHERLEKQSQTAELGHPTRCCQATYNAQREKSKTNEGGGGLSSHSKRLLEHNINSSTEKPPAAAAPNHRRYKHAHSPPNIPSFLPPKGSSGMKLLGGQSQENHHHHHHHSHHKENQHHYKENHQHQADKRQERDLKTSRHHRTSCKNEMGLSTKSASRP